MRGTRRGIHIASLMFIFLLFVYTRTILIQR